MIPRTLPRRAAACLLAALALPIPPLSATPAADETFNIWPGGTAPGENRTLEQPEHVLTGRPRPFFQLTDISVPTLAVFQPAPDVATGAAMLVLPGGGLQRLAIEHEGYEVADWLRSRGVTAFVLKYRVPAPVELGLQDAQRAMALIRAHAATYGIDPSDVGIIGFSAGGEIAAWLSTHYDTLHYPSVDEADQQNTRPDYAVMVYAGGLLQREPLGLKEELRSKLSPTATPPMFITHAFDDWVQNSLYLALALKRAGVPAEVHLFQEGGHGFGVRPTGHPVDAWKTRLSTWLESNGHLDSRAVRDYARHLRAGEDSANFTSLAPEASLAEAYAVQRRVHPPATGAARYFVRPPASPESPVAWGRLPPEDQIGAGLLTPAIGFQVAVDLGYEALTADQARDAVAAVAPFVISSGRPTASVRDDVALNLRLTGSQSGTSQSFESFSLDSVTANQLLNAANTGSLLHAAIREITGRGQTIRSGSWIVLACAEPQVRSIKASQQAIDFGPLGSLPLN